MSIFENHIATCKALLGLSLDDVREHPGVCGDGWEEKRYWVPVVPANPCVWDDGWRDIPGDVQLYRFECKAYPLQIVLVGGKCVFAHIGRKYMACSYPYYSFIAAHISGVAWEPDVDEQREAFATTKIVGK